VEAWSKFHNFEKMIMFANGHRTSLPESHFREASVW